MYTFNSTHLVVGQIKQLLNKINLPRYRIYTKEQEQFFIENGHESNTVFLTKPYTGPDSEDPSKDITVAYNPYIKSSRIQFYLGNNEWVDATTETNNSPLYYDNKYKPNDTKNLIIKNNIYDTYTHEYLGEYLRFLRDYNNLNLMPLYNCFSNTLCNNIELTFNIGTDIAPKMATFKSSDSKYKIYILPVKLLKEYTIAIDCNQSVEICCAIYHKYKEGITTSVITDTENSEGSGDLLKLLRTTYKKYSSLSFNKPVLYDNLTYEKLFNSINIEKYSQIEQYLKLFIKIPANNLSSIAILEGNYTAYNNQYVHFEETLQDYGQLIVDNNRTITNLETDNGAVNFRPITKLQLLKLNTGTSYPFADKLIEYLSGNVITQLDHIYDNIARVQKVMQLNGHNFAVPGAWEDKIPVIIYNDMLSNNKVAKDTTEIFGYIDRDAENNYMHIEYDPKDPTKVISTTTLYDVDIYSEES